MSREFLNKKDYIKAVLSGIERGISVLEEERPENLVGDDVDSYHFIVLAEQLENIYRKCRVVEKNRYKAAHVVEAKVVGEFRHV